MFELAAQLNKAVEIDGFPDRQDLDAITFESREAPKSGFHWVQMLINPSSSLLWSLPLLPQSKQRFHGNAS